jgi:hypothetical protein
MSNTTREETEAKNVYGAKNTCKDGLCPYFQVWCISTGLCTTMIRLVNVPFSELKFR